MSVTAVPIHPLKKGSVLKLWLGILLLALLAAAAAWWTTGKLRFTKTESGLEYQVVANGDGDRPGAGDIASINYAMLSGGRVLESNRGRPPLEQPIDQLPPFLSEALQLMSKGATYRIRVPEELSRGPDGSGAGRKIVFEVTLVDFRAVSAEERRQMQMMRMMQQQMQAPGGAPGGAAPPGAVPEGAAPPGGTPR
jgi:FKBP-type peptidyl-prolyl cis-trans isomerase FkpA